MNKIHFSYFPCFISYCVKTLLLYFVFIKLVPVIETFIQSMYSIFKNGANNRFYFEEVYSTDNNCQSLLVLLTFNALYSYIATAISLKSPDQD